MDAAEYANSLIHTHLDAIAFDSDATCFSLIDSAGDFVGLATWRQLSDSVAAGEEGWIDGGAHGLDVYVDGDPSALAAALKAFWTVTP